MATKKRVQPVRDAIRRRLVEAAVAKGVPREQAEQALSEMESQRPILDWIANGGFESLLKLFLEIVGLFAAPQPPAPAV